ncbi:hypothetical protein FA13DRAFT_1816449 [Coprinellus micaceus]|uniref:Uncharacterized protein n=1 Tax=Coprinellus micaceus TaxID=71717 RepID=A0A4Y7SZR6_COPMI|nr:hypothetical protein FA13DRAFT_1816449 [Coprinellus micaceus]
MAVQRELLIIIDEQDPAFNFEGSWTKSNGVWYTDNCLYGNGNFTLSFNGSSVAFIGNTPERNESSPAQTHTVSIDGGPTYNVTFPLPVPSNPKVQQGYAQWYTTPMLANNPPHNTHNITISENNRVAVDFAIVTINDVDTPISSDHRILVDDQDPTVRYTGGWRSTTSSEYLNFAPFPGGYPVMNSTHQSLAADDCLEFRFTGTSIDVYGLWYPPSRDMTKISIHTTIDGATVRRDPIIAHQNERYQNLLLFTASDLLPTDHTLTLTVSDTSQLVILDYIVYSPSFTRMRDMPDLSGGYKGCAKAAEDNGDSIPVGLIVGVVLGLFVFGLLAIVGVWRWNRRRNRRIRLGPEHSRTSSETTYVALQKADHLDASQDMKAPSSPSDLDLQPLVSPKSKCPPECVVRSAGLAHSHSL